jgi:hypothetical protein
LRERASQSDRRHPTTRSLELSAAYFQLVNSVFLLYKSVNGTFSQGRIYRGAGGLQPPTAGASMENGKGEGEEEVEKRRKIERKR